MSDVFISYSRKDSAFVQRLNTALVGDQRLVWVDWQGIPAGEDWWNEIKLGIENAETFVVVISDNWLKSQICHQELEYARDHNKRILPVIHQQITNDIETQVKGEWMDKPYEQLARDNWSNLGHLNWIIIDSDAVFEKGFERLLQAIDEDQPHLKAHTRYLRRALEWKRSNENPSFLLLGDDLTFAEQWRKIADEQNKLPKPTDLQHRYIMASRASNDETQSRENAREQRIQQFRIASVVLGVIGLVAIIATAIAIPTSIEANNNNATSVAQIETAVNALITATSVVEQVATSDANLATAVHIQETAIKAQGNAESAADDAQTQVAIAGATLTPVPATLTAVASAVAKTQRELNIATRLSSAKQRLERDTINEAIRLVDAIVIDYPEEVSAYIARASIYQELGELDESLSDYTKAIELDPERAQTYNLRSIIYQDMGNIEAALADLAFAINLAPESNLYLNRANLYSSQGNIDAALDDLNTSIELDPRDSAYVMRAGHRKAEGDLYGALADLNSAIALNPQSANVYNSRAFIYKELGDLETALGDFNRAIELEPRYAIYYQNRSHLHTDMGDIEAALTDLSEAIRLAPSNTNQYFSRALLFNDLEQYDDAIADITRYIELNPDEPSGYNVRGVIYATKGEYEKAIRDYDYIIETFSTPGFINVTLYINRGWAYYLLGDYESAMVNFNRVLNASPDSIYGLFNRGLTYLQLGNINLAYQDYEHGIDVQLNNPPYPDEDPLISAIIDLTDAIDQTPDNGNLYLFRGYVHYSHGDTDLAAQDWGRAEELGASFIPEIMALRIIVGNN